MQLKTFFDFCSGIGGGRLGLEKCGLVPVGFSDTSGLSVTTYCTMFKEEKSNNFGNIKKIKGDDLPNFDVLIAGFPCQSFSVIGNGKGFDDVRGQLIFDIARIINESRPKVFILENVRGLVSHNKGKTFETIIELLRKKNYFIHHNILNSIKYGVPQMRQRVFIIGFANELCLTNHDFKWPIELEKPILEDFLTDEDNLISTENYDFLKRYLDNEINIGKYSLSDFLNEEYLVLDTRMSDLRLYRGKVPTLRSHRDGLFYIKEKTIRALTGCEALLLQGFPKEFVGKVRESVSNRHLLKQAGNAMTVNVIEELGKSIIDYLNEI